MDTIDIPSAAAVRARLVRLSHAQTKALAGASGVPFTTLWKVRTGETRNPGVETVRLFWPHLPAEELVGSDGVPPAPPERAPDPTPEPLHAT